MEKNKSIYENTMGFRGEIEITLNADERSMIANALAKCAPYEVDIIPLMNVMQRLCETKRKEIGNGNG